MTTAKEILELIENVDIKDSDKLDEIDAKVWCYLNNEKFERFHPSYPEKYRFWVELDNVIASRDFIHYTRSRDALKSIRPDGWEFTCGISMYDSDYYFCYVWTKQYDMPQTIEVNDLPTEELAELHAIIQAVEWTRNNLK